MGKGNPSKYDPSWPEKLVEHMREGLSFEAFAGVAGVCRKTLYNHLEKEPKFRQAKAMGTELSRLYWEKLGRDNIINESFGNNGGSRSLNSTIWIFNMKNRFGWRDKQPGEEDKTVTHAGEMKVSKVDLDERVAQLEDGDE